MKKLANKFTSAVKRLNEFLYAEPDFRNVPIEQIRTQLKSEGVEVVLLIKKIKRKLDERVR